MKRLSTTLAAALCLAACSPAPAPAPSPSPSAPAPSPSPSATPTVDPAAEAVAALARTHRIVLAGETRPSCDVKLNAAAQAGGDPSVHPASVDQACVKTFPALKTLAAWKVTGGASIELLDARGGVIGDFSPVQDATGVYLRGGAGGRIYELRTPGQD